MEATVTASDFRQKFPEFVKQVSSGKTLIAISRSKPVFRVVPLNADTAPTNWLGKLRDAVSYSEPSMEEINKIVHKLRKEKIWSAHFIVSGDSHLLNLQTVHGIPILTPQQAHQLLDEIKESQYYLGGVRLEIYI